MEFLEKVWGKCIKGAIPFSNESNSKSSLVGTLPISKAELPNRLYFGTKLGFIFCCCSKTHFKNFASMALVEKSERKFQCGL